MRTCLIFKRGGFKMSTIVCVSGRLKMAPIHGGSSKIATICEREGKEEKTQRRTKITKATPVTAEYSASCCQNLMNAECQKNPSPRWIEPITIKTNYVLLGGLEINSKMCLSSEGDVHFHRSRPKGDGVCFLHLELFIIQHSCLQQIQRLSMNIVTQDDLL